MGTTQTYTCGCRWVTNGEFTELCRIHEAPIREVTPAEAVTDVGWDEVIREAERRTISAFLVAVSLVGIVVVLGLYLLFSLGANV